MGYLLVALAAALWALLGVFSRELIDRGTGPVEIGFWRAVIGGACFVLHLAVTRRWRRRGPPVAAGDGPAGVPVARLLAFAVVGVSIFYVANPQAVDAGGVGLAAILLYTAPVFVVVGARVAYGQPITRSRAGLVALTVSGVALVAASAGGEVSAPVAAVAWGLVSGASYSSYYLVGRTLVDRLGPVRTYALALPVGAVALLPLVPRPSFDATEVALVVGVGIVSTYLAYLSFATGLRRVDSARASVVATLEPVLATALGVTLYDEATSAATLAGGAMVVAAALLAARSGDRPARAT